MGTSAGTLYLANNVKLRSPDLPRLDVRDFPALYEGHVAAGLPSQGDDAASPTVFGPIVDGEFVCLDTTYGKIVRAHDADGEWAGKSKHHTEAAKCYLVVGGAGRTDSMYTKMISILYRVDAGFEFDTKVFAGAVSNYAVGDKVAVTDISFDGTTYKTGIGPIGKLAGGTTIEASAIPVGYVVKKGSDFLRVQLY